MWNLTPFLLLFVLSYVTEPTQGTTYSNHTYREVSLAECQDSEFYKSQQRMCFEPVLGRYQMSYISELFLRKDTKVLGPALVALGLEVCSDGQEAIEQAAEAYHCFHGIVQHCQTLLRADPNKRSSSGSRDSDQDWDRYIPDPDLFGDAITHACKAKERDLMCLLQAEDRHWARCFLKAYAPLIKMVLDMDFDGDITAQFNNDFKPALCKLYTGLQNCLEGSTKQCPQPSVAFFDELADLLMPPACRYENVPEMSERDEL